MKIGGLQKSSLIDYPGKVCCVVFLSGCNFHCPYCHNPDLAKGIMPDDKITEYSVFDLLETHKDFLGGVVISGGEPTVQKRSLLSFCGKIKEIGDYSIKLDTNGSNPSYIEKLLRHNVIDYIAMDIKTEHYQHLTGAKNIESRIMESIKIVKESGIDYEFRTTCVKPHVTTETIHGFACILAGAKKYVLQRFVPNIVLCPELYRDNKNICSDEEIEKYKSIMDSYVEECIVS